MFDNLASLEGYFKRNGENLEELFDKKRRPVQAKAAFRAVRGEVVERRFEPHQQMIQVGPRSKGRHERSVLTFMEKATGPMAQLQVWVGERARVKVLVRKSHGIRGSVTGTLRLFDRHWNLVLTEVEEEFQRRKCRYATELCADTATEKAALQRLKDLGLAHPLQGGQVRSVRKKWVEVKKKHGLLLVKGDQVAVVMKGS